MSVTSATGNVLGNRITGKATITTASGRLHVGELADGGVLNNSNGITVVGAARGAGQGPLRQRRHHRRGGGATTSRRRPPTARSGCSTRCAASLTLETAMGEIEVGIHEGSAAWLDVKTKFGLVRNEMTASGAPAERRRQGRDPRQHRVRRRHRPPRLNARYLQGEIHERDNSNIGP